MSHVKNKNTLKEDSENDKSNKYINKRFNKNCKETEIKKVFVPGTKMEIGEELIVDKSAYRILHQAQTGAPCLSFDVIKDDLGNSREIYPMTMYILAGTQAAKPHVNNLFVIKMSNLYGTSIRNYSEEESSDSEEESSDSGDESSDSGDEIKCPVMNIASIKHQGCVNRVRCIRIGDTTLAASWSELGRVTLWDLKEQLRAVESSTSSSAHKKTCQKHENVVKPIFTFKGHLIEGYGLDWCSTEAGTIASGDCKGNIHIWHYIDSGTTKTWDIDQRPYNSHAPFSVEDLQWSPNERHVLASCSIDKSIKIWDTRVNPESSCMLTAVDAHSTDVNVISWNRNESQFIISGGDDGLIKVWDLRQFTRHGASPVAIFKQHLAPVTSIEWHPHEATVFASGGSDNQIAQWDLSVEADHLEQNEEENINNLPPQLLFIHQGQNDIKELHWHPQCPGTIVSTALSGFNIFRTISV